jgi:mxaJ protein
MRVFTLAAAALAGAAVLAARADGARPRTVAVPDAATRVLRVCADPNNLPFSNDRGEGLDNALARLVAKDLGATLEYTWMPQRRGFVRHTLAAGDCDAMMEAPVGWERVLTTRPLYRSSYVFVVRADRDTGVRSLDDARLSRMRIGIQTVGDDYANTPPAAALGRRGLARQVVGYSLYGDYSRPNPPSEIVAAVAAGDVDLALAWGPMAAYFARRQPVAIRIFPVAPSPDGATAVFDYAIGMGVRRKDGALRDELDAVIARHRAEIDRLLAAYSVPRTDRP